MPPDQRRIFGAVHMTRAKERSFWRRTSKFRRHQRKAGGITLFPRSERCSRRISADDPRERAQFWGVLEQVSAASALGLAKVRRCCRKLRSCSQKQREAGESALAFAESAQELTDAALELAETA